MADRTAGDLAIVLHSHMPYVEGFGTYPFGEEWLFDAFARSHLPVLDVAERVTMTITPVLADQLEAEGVGGRMLRFLRRHRVDAADRDVAEAGAALRAAARAEADHYTQAMKRLRKLGGNPLRAFQEAHAQGRVALMSSAATHAVLPKLATLAGRRLQVDAGLPSHGRPFGASPGLRPPRARAPLRRVPRVLAPRVCLRARARGRARRARHRVHLSRSELSRAGHDRPGSDPAPRGAGRLHDRLADGAAGLVRSGLSLRPRLPGVPPPVTEWDAPLVHLRPAVRTGGSRQASRRARRLVPGRRSRPPRAPPRRSGPPRPLRLRNRHRAARPLVGRGADLAGRGAEGCGARRRPPAHPAAGPPRA